ncbi:unnamed protein product [Spirodela intermedia]|uniref:Uncharacterized protein n=2 Tax=Spirodela intermedia TaxID=51605 RepID=A0A7I8J315_SPIIN|nr:unnamed protein product [Spirodela intermedia]CAA6664372.1 unnamed protein product [Spirodela intermedia]CAA7400957.1 unnamed protein product [Spirodela intermedia]
MNSICSAMSQLFWKMCFYKVTTK